MNDCKSPVVIFKENMILERAQELVQSGWCQGGFARTELGEDTWPHDEEAVFFCATGAIIRAMYEMNIGLDEYGEFMFLNPYYINVCQRLIKAIGPIEEDLPWQKEDSIIMCWNDNMMKSSEDVALAFKKALHDVQ